MKALLSDEAGGPETLRMTELPEPSPGPGDLLVRVRACAINYPDVLIIEDKYQLKPPRPFAPGSEIAGEVEQVANDVRGWKAGDRLIAATGFGGLAEKVIVPADRAVRLPPERNFVEGSALLLTYATAIHALVDRGQLRDGQTLLVLGGAGGVGMAAIEVGKALGARVVAAVSSETKAAAAQEAGADTTFVYPLGEIDSKSLAQLFKDAVGPGGADVILDPVGGDYSEAALRSPVERGSSGGQLVELERPVASTPEPWYPRLALRRKPLSTDPRVSGGCYPFSLASTPCSCIALDMSPSTLSLPIMKAVMPSS